MKVQFFLSVCFINSKTKQLAEDPGSKLLGDQSSNTKIGKTYKKSLKQKKSEHQHQFFRI